MSDDERYARENVSAGDCFLDNGDLFTSYHRTGHRTLCVVTGFRGGEKVRVDSWVEDCHPCCGVPVRVGHAHACKTRGGHRP